MKIDAAATTIKLFIVTDIAWFVPKLAPFPPVATPVFRRLNVDEAPQD
jgi:hypothetical protein